MHTTRRRRVSRALIVFLTVILVLGLIFWLHNIDKNRAVRAALRNSAPLQPTALAIEKSALKPLIIKTPTTPTTKPARAPLLIAVTTQPALQAVTERTREVADKRAEKAPTTKPAAQLASATTPPASLSDAKAKLDAGQLLESRKMLNASLVAGTLSPADVSTAKQMLNTINATVVFSSKHFADDEFGGVYQVPAGGVLAKIAQSHEVTAELLQRINGITDPRKLRAGQTIKIVKGPFHAAVFKKDFRLELWLGSPNGKGSMYITSFPVGLGKDDSTPTGTWTIGTKLKNPAYYSPRGEGVIAPSDPNNPLGEYWISLVGTDGHAVGKTSYGIHGTIHPESIGKQESMGCIRMKNEDAAQVFEAMVEGQSTVIVND